MVSEIEYHELIEKNINSNSLGHFILDIEEVYKRENGWNVGDISVTNAENNQIKVSVPIEKLRLNDSTDIHTTYIAIIKNEEYNNEMNTLLNAYTEEDGWTIESPKITPLNIEEMIIRVPVNRKVSNLKL